MPKTNSAARLGLGACSAATTASTSDNGTRFGRVSNAADTARPAANVAPLRGESASTHASSHHMVAGTSLIGSSD